MEAINGGAEGRQVNRADVENCAREEARNRLKSAVYREREGTRHTLTNSIPSFARKKKKSLSCIHSLRFPLHAVSFTDVRTVLVSRPKLKGIKALLCDLRTNDA